MDTKQLRRNYMQILPKLNQVLQYVRKQLSDLPPSEMILETNIKSYPSVKRKMEIDQIREPQELSDLVRGRIFFSDQFQFEDILNILSRLFGKQIKKIDRNRHRSSEHGLQYHGIVHLDLDIDGIRFELRLMPREFQPFKEFLHEIYEKFRDPKSLDKMTEPQKKLLRKIHNRLYTKLNSQAKQNRAQIS